MSTSTPSAKRKRSNDEPEKDTKPPSPEITKSEYWFEDGNVIIQAENTRFRVHRSMLSRHSPVFKDIFDILQPQQTGHPDEKLDGCPIVYLSDKAQDVRHIMVMFYDNISVQDMRVEMPFALFEAILRLGKKYDIPYLLNEGLERLHAEFPDNLSKWDKYDTIQLGQKIADDGYPYERCMALAHELSVNTVLPAICLLFIQSRTPKEILHSLEAVSPTDGTPRYVPHLLKACLEGRDMLLCKVHSTFLGWILNESISPIPGAKCSTSTKCGLKRVEAIASLSAINANFTSFGIMDKFNLKVEIDQKICKECRVSLESEIQKFREEIWNDLPSMFKLGDSWEALKDF